MAMRNIVKIDEDKCNGCGLCVNACVEGAIKVIDGKARLISESYCDGLGACIGNCPQGAITIEKREADKFDEQAAKKHLVQEKNAQKQANFVCPGLIAAKLRERSEEDSSAGLSAAPSRLSHWPVQLKLVSPTAPYFAGADLLLVADCVPFAMGDFHERFLKNRSVVVGCPKLDDAEFYIEKLAAILKDNKLNSLTVIHMEVPCCQGLTRIAQEAIAKKKIEMSFKDVTIDLRGEISRTETVKI